MTPEQFAAFRPAAVATLCMPLSEAFERFGIDTPQRQAAFLGQFAHETLGFTRLQESFNYAPQALVDTFGSARMPLAMASGLGRQPNEAAVPLDRQRHIANIVYANRYGNGGVESGDGWQFRGRGLTQLTFRDNYRAASVGIFGDNRLLLEPDLVARPITACLTGAWFWKEHGCNELADGNHYEMITERINGPAKAGLSSRIDWWNRARLALGC